MTFRRGVIVFATAAIAHNILRMTASALGQPAGIWNYLPPYHPRPQGASPGSFVLVVVLLGILALLWRAWRWPQSDASKSLWASAVGSALVTVPVILLAIEVSTTQERTYGLALFVLVPLVAGFLSAFLLGQRMPIGVGDAMTAAALSVLLLGGALVGLAMEGVVCLLMALPIAIPLALLGAALAYWLHRKPLVRHPATFLLIAGLTPFGATVEHALVPPQDWYVVTTAIDIPASPARVWQTVLQPAQLRPPSGAVFRAGVAYPLASHIEGAGLSATRYCDFSTGKLVEPVLIWEQGQRLRFRVASNPLPMQEWTPYAQIHPPHLEGFLVSRQGEFRLTPLENGGTRLEATTWYQHHLAPGAYWRLWSDSIIHQVHEMVLENIRERALKN